jgi:O-antigen/teichoic acid export membrane protein
VSGAKPNLLRKIFHTFATLVFGQGASIAAGIATAHAFGPSGKGVLALGMILLTFAVTTADGVRDAVAYQIGREKLEPRAVWGTALRLLGVLAPIGAGFFFVLWRFSPGQLAFLFAAIAFPFALYVQAAGVLYQLRDRIEKINVQNAATIGGGISIVTLALVTLFHASVETVLLLTAAAYAAAALWAMSGVRELIGGRANLRAVGLIREQIVFGSKVALSSNVTLLALRVDVFVVGALLSPSLLGIYTLALSTGEVLYNVSRAVLWSSTGQIATLDFEASAALCARIVRTLVALQAVAAALLFAVGPWLITLVYGARFAESGGVLRLLLPGVIFYSADGMLSYFIAVKSARPGILLAMECVTLCLTFAITYFAIARIGIYAGALAHTIAFLVSYAVKSTIFVRLSGLAPRDVLLPRRSDLAGLVRLGRRPGATG